MVTKLTDKPKAQKDAPDRSASSPAVYVRVDLNHLVQEFQKADRKRSHSQPTSSPVEQNLTPQELQDAAHKIRARLLAEQQDKTLGILMEKYAKVFHALAK